MATFNAVGSFTSTGDLQLGEQEAATSPLTAAQLAVGNHAVTVVSVSVSDPNAWFGFLVEVFDAVDGWVQTGEFVVPTDIGPDVTVTNLGSGSQLRLTPFIRAVRGAVPSGTTGSATLSVNETPF